nr:hypothetical protein [Tanacetum cinerariifolium]
MANFFIVKDKLDNLKQSIPPAPVPAQAGQQVDPEALAAHAAWVKGSKEIARLMFMILNLDIQQNLENLGAYEMLQELKTLFAQQAEYELLQTVRDFHSCKQEERQRSRKLKPGALSLYMSNGQRVVVEAIGSYHLCLPSGLVIVLNNCHYASFITRGYPKETMDYSFYYPPENKVLIAQNAEFLENSLITQEASGSLEDLKSIQEEDTHPSIDTSLNHEKNDLEINEPQSDIIPIRRSTRTRNAPNRMCLYIDVEKHELGDLGEPTNYKSALLDHEFDKWLNAMNVEMQSMKDNEKTDVDGAVHTFKARLVAKGFTQTYKVDYKETFSPVAEIRAIKILIAIAAYYDYEIWQMDVKTAFLNGHLSEEAYMKQPGGFVNPKYPNRGFHVENSKHRSIPMQEKLRLSKSQVASTLAELKRMQNVPYALAVGYLTDANDLTSKIGYVFILNGGAIDWKSTKQSIFATSSAEAEYIAAYDASKEVVWLRKFFFGLGIVPIIEEPINMYCDNTRAITIADESGIIKADPFTKALAFPKHSKHTRNIKMLPASSLIELVLMGKEKRNFLMKHITWLVDDLDVWNSFPWGEYMWDKFYNRTVNVVSRHTENHLAQLKKNSNFNATYNLYGFAWAFKMSNPNVPLIASRKEMSHAWFKDSAEFIKGLDAQDGTFLQDDQCREKSMEQHNGMCGDTEDCTFVHRVVVKICPKMNRMSVDDGDAILDSQSDDGDGVLDSQTKDVIEEASMLPTMSLDISQAGNAAASSSSAHLGNDEDVSHLADNMEINGPNAKDLYSNSQHHLYLIIKGLCTKIENLSIDSVLVVPLIVDDPMLRTIKPKDDFDEAENLSRPDGCKSDKVTIPEYMSAFINNKDLPEYRFLWGKRDVVHLDVWIDLMWSLRPPEEDWAIVSPHFSTCILNGMMQDYFSNGHMYHLPWIAVEKALVETNEEGIARETNSVSTHAWLCRNLPVAVDNDPLETALAYRESSKTINSVKQIHAIVDGKVVVILESSVRSDLIFDDEDGKVTPLFDSMLVQNQAPKGEGSTIPPEPQPTPSTSQPTTEVTPRSDEGRLKLDELIALRTKLSKQVLDLEKEKDAQTIEILNLKKRVKKLERKNVESEIVDAATTRVSTVSVPVTTAGVTINVEDSSRPTRSITTPKPLPSIDPKDKGKCILVEGEPVKAKRKDQGLAQVESDAELAQRLHEEELAELKRVQKETQMQEEATIAVLAEEYDQIQTRMDADEELAARLTLKEQEKYTIKKRARLLVEFFERRKKQLAAERAEAIRNKPPTKTQVRNRMITYLKHMVFEKESSKKQYLEEEYSTEKEELKANMDIVPKDDIPINVESLATKYPIVDWKTHILNENMMYYQIIRAYGSSKNYKIFSKMLDYFSRQYVIDLHRKEISSHTRDAFMDVK